IPAAGTAIRVHLLGDVDDDIYSQPAPAIHVDIDPGVEYITGNAPHVTTCLTAPQMRRLIAPLTQRIEKLAACFAQGFSHACIPFDRDGLIVQWRVAIIVFEKVDPPGSPQLRILV